MSNNNDNDDETAFPTTPAELEADILQIKTCVMRIAVSIEKITERIKAIEDKLR